MDDTEDQCDKYWQAREWPNYEDACNWYQVNPPPPPVRPDGPEPAPAASTADQHVDPSSSSTDPAPRARQSMAVNAHHAQIRRQQRDSATRVAFAIDTAAQNKARQQREKHAEKWMLRDDETGRWRLE